MVRLRCRPQQHRRDRDEYEAEYDRGKTKKVLVALVLFQIMSSMLPLGVLRGDLDARRNSKKV